MEKVQSLAEFLGTDPGLPQVEGPHLEDITDSKAFAIAVLDSLEFKQYIVNGLKLGELPAAVVCRLMDYGWGKSPDRVEHTGKDGKPIETVTEVRRIVVRASDVKQEDSDRPKYVTH